MSPGPLAGKVALVTGATRGIGKGIALQLSENGAKVYITGRTLKPKPGSVTGGSLEETKAEIEKRGGQCIPVVVDHENDKQVESLFKQIEAEQKGQLDLLVNNAYKGVETIFGSIRQKFWESDTKVWDEVNNVGLRNHYICTVYASRLMVPRKSGLIVNISSLGGQAYLFNVAYGIGKVAVDRMAIDCAVELKKHNVASLSLMLGAVRTEITTKKILNSKNDKATIKSDADQSSAKSIKKVFEEGESVEFGGKVLVSMASNSNIMDYSGKIVIAAEYAEKHDIVDIDQRRIPSHREFSQMGELMLPKSMRSLKKFVPKTLKIPQFLIDIATSKYKTF